LSPNRGEVPGSPVTETCIVTLEACVSEADEGETWIVKGAACLTVSENVTVCVIAPLVPATVTVLAPSGEICEADNWNAVPLVNPVMAMENGPDGEAVTPVGRPEIVKLMVPVNPLREFA
jgi:hypothetical protein